jgi:chitin-binding protein
MNSNTPTAPSNLVVVPPIIDNITDNSIKLEWDLSTFDPNAGDTGYSIYGRIGSSGDFLFHSNVSTTDHANAQDEYNVTGLSAGTQYQFKVRAFDTFAPQPNSAFSNIVTQSTTDATDLIPPGVPTEFTASNITQTSVTLSWFFSFNPDGTQAAGYKLYRGTTLIANLTTTTIYNVTGLTSGTLYKFFVSAYDLNGNESNTNGPLNVTTL